MNRICNRTTLSPFIGIFLLLTIAASPAQASEIKGRVMDFGSQIAIKGATVKLIGSDQLSLTDVKGNFAFHQLSPGVYSLTTSAPGHYELTEKIAISDASPVNVDVFLIGTLTSSTVISVTGVPERIEDTTRSVGVVESQEISGTRRFSLDEFLNSVPGVRADMQSDTENVRVSIRGRGIRTSFGMRGIKVLVDGIPESDASGELPDLTGLDMGTVERAEIVKGPMSAEYGANSGGVLNLITKAAPTTPEIDLENIAGSYDYLRSQVEIGGHARQFDYLLHGARIFQHGFRANSRLISYKYDNRLGVDLSKTAKLTFFVKGGLSDQQLPGNLTQTELDTNRDQAAALFRTFRGDTDIKRIQGSVKFDKTIGTDSSFSATFFERVLDFNLSLPFLFEEGHRPEFGTALQYQLRKRLFGLNHKFTFGGQLQRQREDRHDFGNSNGKPTTSPRRNEIRRVIDSGGYAFDEIQLSRKLLMTLALNYSQLHFNIQDFLAGNSGANTFDHVSYQVGAAYHFTSNASLYGNVSTGFETPTITELGRDPSGRPGVNLSLRPQELTNFEGGALFKFTERAYVNAALFQTRVRNEIVPTGLGNPQGTFINAAKTIHNGTELSFGSRIVRDLDFKLAYTHSDFHFDRFINVVGKNFSGNVIPALPQNHLNFAFSYHNRYGFIGGFNDEVVGREFVNDSNTASAPKYNVGGANFGYGKSFERLRVKALYGVANLFNERYSSYIVANDQFGSYFYPAANRNHYGSVSVSWIVR